LPPRLRGVIFDLDGTLADTLPVCFAAFRRTFETHLGETFSDREIRAMFGPSEEGILRRRCPEGWPAALETYLREYERAHTALAAPFVGIEDVLTALERLGVRRAIVTGKGAGSAAISSRMLGLAPHFDVIETGSGDGRIKPDRIRTVLGRWELPAAAVAYVGDAPSDIEVAREVGLVALAAAWAPTAEPERMGELVPDALFLTVASFAAWIEAHVEDGPDSPRRMP
jgi:phosphoglycolate phosphatase-like HAD superfamily hydrolase